MSHTFGVHYSNRTNVPETQSQDAVQLRLETNRSPKSSYPPKPSLNKAEHKAMQELKKDESRVILTGDKGIAMVVIDR